MIRALALVLSVFVVSCSGGPAVASVDCATATVPTYAELGNALAYCTSCHGASRHDEGVRYDTYALAKQNAARGADEIASGAMPEGTDMPDELAQQLVTWAACETPE